ncbi:MAG: GAF domain-containing protein [Acidobacteriota bacterium]|nr:GAF domain-containing protein [Acidobacteriota bacterium]
MPYRRIRDVDRLHALVGAMLLIGEDLDLPTVLRTIVQTAVDVVGARYGALGVLDDTGSGLAEFVTVGFDEAQVAAVGRLPQGLGVLGLLIKHPTALRLADIGDHDERAGFPPAHPPMTSFLGVPISVRNEPFGNLYLTDKAGGAEFTEEDEDLVSALAKAAALAIDRSRAHSQLLRLSLADEQERIGRDLHDTTIRRLFAVGLTLHGAKRLLGRPEAGARLQQAIDELDDTIREIRSTVFAVNRRSRQATGGSLAGELLQVVEDYTPRGGSEVRLELDGPIDAVGHFAGEHLLLSVRQILDALAARPRSAAVDLRVAVDGHGLTLEITDAEPAGLASELPSLGERARLLGGDCRVEPVAAGGMQLIWQVTRLQ